MFMSLYTFIKPPFTHSLSFTLSLTCSLDPDLHVHDRLILPLVIPGDSAREGLVDLLDLSGLEVHKFGNFFFPFTSFARGCCPFHEQLSWFQSKFISLSKTLEVKLELR